MSTGIFELALDELENVKGVRIVSVEDLDGTIYKGIVVVMKENEQRTEAVAVTETRQISADSQWPQRWPVLKGCLIAVEVCALSWVGIVILFMWMRG